MAAAVGRLLRASVARHVSSFPLGISAAFRTVATRNKFPANVMLTSATSPKLAFSTSTSTYVPAVTQHAPHFKGTAVVNGEFREISLDDFKGKYLVLFFYPLDFTFVCLTEIVAGLGHMNIALLSDLTKQISRDYGVLLEGPGLALKSSHLLLLPKNTLRK
ncbi:thioredoxin-dependent peroxide reductase, mitochondrial-like isoform X2 [Gracilinanus agilis]|uniref:thioredoxin-dependent peroxide reductase, mitochondrial-like isoform X2 n=1 Tax=Gracilinanus agilis TaxID=191870 RepID=UPI001CFCEED8|nr:thioredoxin-dependent peroxide reductase, mitochondrial-like isoform X2 [Gracilinanus agilis]